MSKPKSNDLQLYRRLILEARPYWAAIVSIFALDMLAIPLALLAPVPLQLVVDHVLGPKSLPAILKQIPGIGQSPSPQNMLVLAISIIVLLALVRQIQGMVCGLLRSYTGNRLVSNFRAKLFRHVQRLSLMYHDTQGSSDSAYRIQYDAPAIQHIAIDGVIPFITSVITLAAMIYVTAKMDGELALIALIVAPFFYFLVHWYRKPLRRRYHQLKSLEASALFVVQEVLAAVRVVKAFGREDHEHGRYLRHAEEGVKARIRVELFQGIYDLLVGLTTAIGTASVLYFGVRHVQEGKISLGQLLMIMSYLAQLYAPIRAISTKSADIQASLASAERALALLDRVPDVADRPHAAAIARSSGHITFSKVSFCYEPDRPVLNGISFDILPGSRVGIAGHTGAGKTTLMSLLTRFYDPTQGEILIDGIDLRDCKLADLRNQYAIVLQDAVLFSTSIAENIAYARPGASEKEIIAASKAAHAHEFISGFPQGYETKVGERGMKLSGGERQRISLARAFLKDAPILILDEPTSSIDVKTETLILDAMEKLMQGRTTFMIAHRLSTLEHCDVRLNLENGRLISSFGPSVPPLESSAQILTPADSRKL